MNTPLEEKTVVYSLEDDSDLYDLESSENQTMDLIPTSEFIKSFDVVSEDVISDISEDDFVINEIASDPLEEDIPEVQEQTMLSFDLPLQKKAPFKESRNVQIYELQDDVNEIEVDDYIELVAINESSLEEEKRYTLDDHIILENTNQEYEPSKQNTPTETEVDTELVFSKVTVKERQVTKAPEENADPFDSPISKALRDRADERRQKMKAFNYKFNTSKVEEFEKEPAYKRQGIELNEANNSNEPLTSRSSVALDENDDVQVRTNNSFLHDNVD
jgi:cell division protein FtsZ